jgi:hypothetical protein
VALRHNVDHGGGKKVGANSRGTRDNRQQWQRQCGKNQLKVTSGEVDSCGGGSKQWRSTEIGSKTPTAKAIILAPPTPLLSSSAGGGRLVAAAAAKE